MTGSKQVASAIATLREAGIHIVVLFHTLVVGGGSLLTKRPGDSEGAVIDDVLVVILVDNCSSSSSFMSASLTFLGVFSLTEGADVEIIVDNSLNRYDTPFRFCFDSVFFTGLVLPLFLRHSGCGNSLCRQVIGDPFAVDIPVPPVHGCSTGRIGRSPSPPKYRFGGSSFYGAFSDSPSAARRCSQIGHGLLRRSAGNREIFTLSLLYIYICYCAYKK